jgi:gliding motility-associated lipoprotein GldH
MATIRTLTLLVIITSFMFAGCSNDKSVTKINSFSNSTWERFDYVTFDFPIDEENVAYNIYLLIRYTSNFPSEALLINFVMTLPSGEERIRDYRIALKEKDGSLLGEAKAGYYEQLKTIRKGMLIGQSGNLNIEIENLMTKYYTPGIVELGVILEPSNQAGKP